MEISWLSLTPPCVVMIVAFITRSLNKSLLAGIVCSALVTTQFSISNSITLMTTRFWQQLIDLDKLYLYIFLLSVAALVTLYNFTGCAVRFAHMITNKIRTARTIQFASMLVSCALSLDDYLSILATGFVMSPITDTFAIARQKLAFLVHSLAGVVVILMPISSWVAIIIVYLQQSGIDTDASNNVLIHADPFFIYLKTVPFMFYSLLMIASVWFIVRNSLSFGPMHQKEVTAHASQKSHTNTFSDSSPAAGAITNLLVPLALLITTMFIGMLYAGGYHLMGGTHSFFDAIKNNTQPFLIMAIASVTALTSGIGISLYRRSITIAQLHHIVFGGITLMHSAITMVFLAAVLGVMLKNDTQTGHYLATLLVGSVSLSFLPMMFFIGSFIVTVATGSAWATFSTMLAIAIPMLTSLLAVQTPAAPETMPLLFPIIGAIFSGAVCGDHISPLSETTVMTATSTGIDPLDHAYTQFFYAIPAIVASLIAFIVAGHLTAHPAWMQVSASLATGLSVCFGLLLCANKYFKLKSN
jgi:tetracycline resistance efflux pump